MIGTSWSEEFPSMNEGVASTGVYKGRAVGKLADTCDRSDGTQLVHIYIFIPPFILSSLTLLEKKTLKTLCIFVVFFFCWFVVFRSATALN